MLIDFHTHIFSPEICQQRERYCTRDPWFSKLYSSLKANLVSAEDLITEMDVAGVDISVAFSFGWSDPGLIHEGNDYILDAMRRYPGRIHGLAVLQPTVGQQAVYELERCVQGGMLGVGELMPHGQGYRLSDIDLLRPIMEVIERQDLLLLSHCSEPIGHLYPGKGDVTLLDTITFLTAFPTVRFIAAHWGGGLPFYTLMPEIQRLTAGRVWYDTAATLYLYRPEIFATVANLVGPEYILFGSDYGLLRQGRVIEHIKSAGLDDSTQQLILGENAWKLLRLR
ncbi:MAG: amidohydrolase family protein [Ktedonobacteraceae bacterium]